MVHSCPRTHFGAQQRPNRLAAFGKRCWPDLRATRRQERRPRAYARLCVCARPRPPCYRRLASLWVRSHLGECDRQSSCRSPGDPGACFVAIGIVGSGHARTIAPADCDRWRRSCGTRPRVHPGASRLDRDNSASALRHEISAQSRARDPSPMLVIERKQRLRGMTSRVCRCRIP
jgi:hypothetical protein